MPKALSYNKICKALFLYCVGMLINNNQKR